MTALEATKVKLIDVARVVSGGTPKTSTQEFWDGDVLWATPKDLSKLGKVEIASTPRTISQSGLQSCSAEVLPVNSVLFSSRAPIGLIAINSAPMATNQGFKSFVPDASKLDSHYLYRWLEFEREWLQSLGVGATFKEVSKATISRVELPLPPLPEQRRIAAILDKADRLRTQRRETLTHLDALTQSIFHDMFGDSDFPVTTVAAVGTVQLGRQRAPKYQTGKFTTPYMRVANVRLNSLALDDVLSMDFDEKDTSSYMLAYGDILLNEGQSTELVGRPAMWRNEIEGCCFQNTLVRFIADRSIVVPEFALAVFLKYFHDGEFSKISSKTSNVAHLGAARFARMPFLVPPLELQQTFARRVAAVERLKEKHRDQLAELDALFASLQHRAFQGEL